MGKLIFLSHIHEERTLAQTIQETIENEFSGFVDVFVSSDGKTIPAGANFLKRIENGLIDCIGSLYLISPVSVKRNWINFELGAVWIRNVISQKNDGPEIPTIPICHSGMTINKLPMPLTNLNAIQGHNSTHLEAAFKSIQTAVGGRGQLKTNFDELAQKISSFEIYYTMYDNLITLFKALNTKNSGIIKIIEYCETNTTLDTINLFLEFTREEQIRFLKNLEANGLRDCLSVTTSKFVTKFINDELIYGADTALQLKRDCILKFKDDLIKDIK